MFGGTFGKMMSDNVFIAMTRLGDKYPIAIQPRAWSDYNNSSYVLDGVLVISGGKQLVVATQESALRWGNDSDSHAASGNTVVNDRDDAMADWEGKTRTDTAVQVSEYIPATTACGYCHAYSTVSGYSSGISYDRRKAGAWWLPSIGELMLIAENQQKINQVMTLVGGTPLSGGYASSTEQWQSKYWSFNMDVLQMPIVNKNGTTNARPVCAF